MLAIGACFSQPDTSEHANQSSLPSIFANRPLVKKYREAAVQCLTLGRCEQISEYVVETLLHLVHIQHLQNEDTEMETWVMLGVAIRLAQRLGYHRDGSQFPDLTIFQAEMRRRVWAVISDLDISISASFGLPRMINPIQCDAGEPRHLRDNDLHRDLIELPPSISDEEETPLLYVLGRQRILSLAARVSDFLSLGHTGRQEEALLLDERLCKTYDQLPDCIKPQDNRSAYDHPDGGRRLLQSMYLALVYYKTRCVLHRPYLFVRQPDTSFTASRKYCLKSALQLLKYQSWLYRETQPGGILAKQWKMSFIVKHDFLLATTVLVFDIDQAQTSGTITNDSLCQVTLEALSQSYPIWLEWATASREARKAVDMLRVVLGKTQEPPADGVDQRQGLGRSNSQELVDALMSLSEENATSRDDYQRSTPIAEQFFMVSPGVLNLDSLSTKF